MLPILPGCSCHAHLCGFSWSVETVQIAYTCMCVHTHTHTHTHTHNIKKSSNVFTGLCITPEAG